MNRIRKENELFLLHIIIAFVCGSIAAILCRTYNVPLIQFPLRPLILLGETLRAWSLSGAWGNTAAWISVILLSILPFAIPLLLRLLFGTPLEPADALPLLPSAGIFVCLYLLINPTLIAGGYIGSLDAHFGSTASSMLPAFFLFIIVTLFLLNRLLHRHLFSPFLNEMLSPVCVLPYCIMMLKAASIGYVLTENIQSMPIFLQGQYSALPLFYSPAAFFEELAPVLPSLISSIGSLPVLYTLHCSALVIRASLEHGFDEATIAASDELASIAKAALITVSVCMVIRNGVVLLCGILFRGFSAELTLPLTDIALSCCIMLLSQFLSGFCMLAIIKKRSENSEKYCSDELLDISEEYYSDEPPYISEEYYSGELPDISEESFDGELEEEEND